MLFHFGKTLFVVPALLLFYRGRINTIKNNYARTGTTARKLEIVVSFNRRVRFLMASSEHMRSYGEMFAKIPVYNIYTPSVEKLKYYFI